MTEGKPIRFNPSAVCAPFRTVECEPAQAVLPIQAYRFDIPRTMLEEARPLQDAIGDLVRQARDALDAKVFEAARAAWANGEDFMVATSTVMTDARPPAFEMTLSRLGQAVPKGTDPLPGFAILRPVE